MRALVQRVSEASVTAKGGLTGEIGCGLAVFLGIKNGDTPARAERLAHKIAHLRIFPDDSGKMNRSLLEMEGELLVVSQFTLYADTRGGNRPSYGEAAPAEIAEPLYRHFVQCCSGAGLRVATGVFQAHMRVRLVNDGPVTLLCGIEE
ncbi:MAG: D-aminoacyl-tRNA deacylase [Bryobacteraceae bacterium]